MKRLMFSLFLAGHALCADSPMTVEAHYECHMQLLYIKGHAADSNVQEILEKLVNDGRSPKDNSITFWNDWNITSENLALIAEKVGQIGFHNASITLEQAKAIVYAISREKSNVWSLYLSGSMGEENDELEHGSLEIIVKGISNSQKLKILELDNRNIDDNGAILLSTILETNSHLISLSLCNNKIGNRGAERFANFVNNSNLISFGLYGNPITDLPALTTIYQTMGRNAERERLMPEIERCHKVIESYRAKERQEDMKLVPFY